VWPTGGLDSLAGHHINILSTMNVGTRLHSLQSGLSACTTASSLGPHKIPLCANAAVQQFRVHKYCVIALAHCLKFAAMSDSLAGTKRKARAEDETGEEERQDTNSEATEQNEQPAAKRSRINDPSSTTIIAYGDGGAVGPDGAESLLLPSRNLRTSPLFASPEVTSLELLGHSAQVLSARFSPAGTYLASGSRDKTALIWRLGDAADNICVLRGHSNAITQLCWRGEGSTGAAAAWDGLEDAATRVYTASADKTCGVWDINTGTRVRKLIGHTSIVNACAATRRGDEGLVSVADDGVIKMWDCRSRGAAATFSDAYPLLSVAYGADSSSIFTGGVDGVIRQWDTRKHTVLMKLEGHGDAVTGLSVSPDGNSLLSFGMDSQLCAWDVRPFSKLGDNRCIKTFGGASNNFEQMLIRCSWSASGDQVACGSADRLLYVWDYESGQSAYILPGHTGMLYVCACVCIWGLIVLIAFSPYVIAHIPSLNVTMTTMLLSLLYIICVLQVL
jgi:Prp8 binding protein